LRGGGLVCPLLLRERFDSLAADTAGAGGTVAEPDMEGEAVADVPPVNVLV